MTPHRALIEAAEEALATMSTKCTMEGCTCGDGWDHDDPAMVERLREAISSAKAAEEGVETTDADPLKPTVALLVKLGSIAVHAEELTSPKGHHYDKSALETLMQDKEVSSWMQNMDKMAFLPKKR